VKNYARAAYPPLSAQDFSGLRSLFLKSSDCRERKIQVTALLEFLFLQEFAAIGDI
jgi:hypothetical protein